jgi:transposase-like protein
LGVTVVVGKILLGFINPAAEKERVIKGFLRSLLARGLSIEEGIFCVLDDAKGLYSAIRKVIQDRVLIKRYQWHKRENVLSYLPKSHQATWRRRLRRASEKPTYEEAKSVLNRLKPKLKLLNQSASAGLEKGLKGTITLHRLGLFTRLRISLESTHCTESVMSLVGQNTDRVECWRNSF